MTRRILIERAAELDIAEITTEIREHRPASAPRFVKAAREAFQSLAAHPEMGRQYETTHPLLQNLRIWRVKGFESYLIFYRAGHASLYIWKPESSNQALTIGLMWLGLTIAFEFLFFHYVMGHPWSRLLHDYNVFAGRVWVVILIWITVAPYVFYRMQR